MITLQDIEQARERIGGVVQQTPCQLSKAFSDELGLHAWFKYENLQLTGSFKVRGAYNKIASLCPEASRRGVIAASAGNHAQGVAYSATRLGVLSTILMPITTPLIKVENTRRLGGIVELEGELFDDAYEAARRLERERGLVFIHPFDDETVMAGQGTIGLEILEQTPEVEVIVVPVGGGGLISGVAAAVKEKKPSVRIYGVQTDAAPAMAQSFKAGKIVHAPVERSLADGIAVKRPGEHTFEHIQRYVDGICTVSEDEIRSAVIRLLETGKTSTEGAAAATLAALVRHRIPAAAGRHVVMILSGANIDIAMLSRIIDRFMVESHRLVRFRTHVPDRPGGLAEMLQVISGHGGNVKAIQHDRVFMHAGFWEAQVDAIIETRNSDHIESLRRALRQSGYTVERLE